jgi:hypothetical protein
MFETSQDIWYITLSVCVAVLTAFVCWGIYYGIRIVKGIFEIIDKIERTADRVEHLVVETRDKVEKAFGAMNITSQAVKGVLEYFTEKKNSYDDMPN